MAEKETIVTKMYDLVKYLMPVINRFPRDYKFTLGDRISPLADAVSSIGFESAPRFIGLKK